MIYLLQATELASPLESFLKQLPEVASSPLAFVAYCLVIAAWVVTTWLGGKPEREAKEILNQFHDDQLRTVALRNLIGKEPPNGLTGNDAILGWVAANNRIRSQMLFLVGWAVTLIAIIIFAVAWRTMSATGSRQVGVQFHRQGTVSDCPDLGEKAHLAVSVDGRVIADVPVVEKCKATLPVSVNEKRFAMLSLADAGKYSLAAPSQKYALNVESWDVYLNDLEQSRVRISIFDYAGECPGGSDTYKTVEEILEEKANTLRSLFASDDPRFNYLSRLHLVPTGSILNLSPNEVREYSDETSSLQVLGGMCFPNGKSEVMRSRIFSGSLHGDLPEPFMVELPLVPEEFRATRDVHTASML
jgi:hypothetical protein